MLQCGLIADINDPRFEGFWRMFCEDMEKHNYVSSDEDDDADDYDDYDYDGFEDDFK